MNAALLLLPILSGAVLAETVDFQPSVDFQPRQYVCAKTPSPIVIDGKLDEAAWAQADWTDEFVDIEGEKRPLKPRYRTRAKMLWDDEYLYIAVYMEEPHVWAKLTERESIIFYDNDFEVFIDPNGDTHHYMEYEINAFGTEWDLMLTKPYRDWGCKVLDSWNINGVRSAIHVDGTINKGDDEDKGWSVEIAMPLDSITEADKLEPAAGVQWRINFSRVEWFTQWDGKEYQKIENPLTKKSGPGSEDNWVWSPQGVVNMHRPETWGFLQFSERLVSEPREKFNWNRNEEVKWALRQLYQRMQSYKEVKKTYPSSLAEIRADEVQVKGLDSKATYTQTETDWTIALDGFDGKRYFISSDGRCWEKNDQ